MTFDYNGWECMGTAPGVWQGVAKWYKKGKTNIVISYNIVFYVGPETMAFPADKNGKVKNFGELACVRGVGPNFEQCLDQIDEETNL